MRSRDTTSQTEYNFKRSKFFLVFMFDIRSCFRKDLTSDLVNLQDNKGNSPLLVCAIKNSRDTLRLIFLSYWSFSSAKKNFILITESFNTNI